MRAVIVLALCLTAVNAVPSHPHRIIGGSVTFIENYPNVVSLKYSWNSVSFWQTCAGVILNTRAVLTAAHCPAGDAIGRWRVSVGSTFANSGGMVHNVATITIHPNYDSRTNDNDIGIIRTSTVIVHNDNAKPASIAGANTELADNEVVWAVGWGYTSAGGSPSEQLRQVQIWVINQAICSQRYAAVGSTITNNMLCSGWLDVGGRDQCQGDAGGPLYQNDIVVGIRSWGRGCADYFFPGVNTRVSRYTTWIQANA